MLTIGTFVSKRRYKPWTILVTLEDHNNVWSLQCLPGDCVVENFTIDQAHGNKILMHTGDDE